MKPSTRVPFIDLRARYAGVKTEVDAAMARVLESADFTLGVELERFETAFAEYVGVRFAVGVSSGTDALELALRASGIGPGDEVIAPANTFVATGEAIVTVGADLRLADVDPHTFNMDPTAVQSLITPRTKAIIPVHLYGQPADMDAIGGLARQNGLTVIEDCAQSHGAKWRGKKTGGFGHAACFSFYPAKNLGAFGDAGAVVTNDEQVADKIRMLRHHGQKGKNEHLLIGGTRRLDTLQAAVLGAMLPSLDHWNEARRRAARTYEELFAGMKGVDVPYCSPLADAVYHLFVIQAEDRDELRRILTSRGIDTGVHYPVPLHRQPAFRYLECLDSQVPVATRLSERILSLPMYPELTRQQIEYVVDAVKDWLRDRGSC
jgi:dTDP-4-amino-4,6-dideoxygalactose transaminase